MPTCRCAKRGSQEANCALSRAAATARQRNPRTIASPQAMQEALLADAMGGNCTSRSFFKRAALALSQVTETTMEHGQA